MNINGSGRRSFDKNENQVYLCGWRSLHMDGDHANSYVMGALLVLVNLFDQCIFESSLVLSCLCSCDSMLCFSWYILWSCSCFTMLVCVLVALYLVACIGCVSKKTPKLRSCVCNLPSMKNIFYWWIWVVPDLETKWLALHCIFRGFDQSLVDTRYVGVLSINVKC